MFCKIAPHDSHQLFKILVTKSDESLSIQLRGWTQFIWAVNKIISLCVVQDGVIISFPQRTSQKTEKTCSRQERVLVSHMKSNASRFCYRKVKHA